MDENVMYHTTDPVNVEVDETNKAPDFEIEVVDDTPESDKNRHPLPDEIKNKLDEDDGLEGHSKGVQERINQLKKAWHDERREKEAAQREKEEAAKFAQAALKERQVLQQRLQNGEVWAIDQARQRAALMVEQAQREFKEAYESGDAEKLAEAQKKVSFATIDFNQFNNYIPQHAPLQTEKDAVYTNHEQAPAPKPIPPKLKEWVENNPWFNSDEEMKGLALGVHRKLIESGVAANSDEYFERINSRMREAFPNYFGVKTRRPSTVVAPDGRSQSPKKVVLTQTQVALAKKLGLTNAQYAAEIVKLNGGV